MRTHSKALDRLRVYQFYLCLTLTAAGALSTTGCLGTAAHAADSSVTAAERPVTSYSFGPAFTAPKSKKLIIISCGSAGIGCQFVAKGAQEAASALGWASTIVDGKFDPKVWNTAVQQAVADGADGVVMAAVSPALIQGGLEQARAAKIPVITVLQPKFPGAPLIDGYVTSDQAAAGTLVARWIADDSGGRAYTLILDVSEFPEIMKRNDALATELGRICPDCKMERQRFGAALAAQRLAPLVTAQLGQHPDIGYVTGPYDATGTFIAQGIRQAHMTGKVKYVNFDGNPVGFDLMKAGEQAADFASSDPFGGWLAVDILARKLAGQPYPEEAVFPQRLFLAGEPLPASERGWDTDFDYRSELQKLWLK